MADRNVLPDRGFQLKSAAEGSLRICLAVSVANHRSTRLIHDALVGLKLMRVAGDVLQIDDLGYLNLRPDWWYASPYYIAQEGKISARRP